MAYINLEDVNRRLESQDNILNIERKRCGRGRRGGEITIPLENKVLIAATAQFDTQKNVGAAFGVSQQEVGMLARGRVDMKGKEDPVLKAVVDNVTAPIKKEILESAVSALRTSLGLLTEDKLISLKATDLSRVSKDMASVVEKIEDRKDPTVGNTKVIIYAPRVKEISEFDVITVAAQAVND